MAFRAHRRLRGQESNCARDEAIHLVHPFSIQLQNIESKHLSHHCLSLPLDGFPLELNSKESIDRTGRLPSGGSSRPASREENSHSRILRWHLAKPQYWNKKCYAVMTEIRILFVFYWELRHQENLQSFGRCSKQQVKEQPKRELWNLGVPRTGEIFVFDNSVC